MYGFKFHHAEGDSSSMLLWLPENENRVPPYATHHVCLLSSFSIKNNLSYYLYGIHFYSLFPPLI